MTLAVRMSVVPKQARGMIAWNLYQVVQHLARHGEHSEHVILWGVRRNSKPMKMQVRHVHARVHRTSLAGLGRKVVDVGDSKNVARGSPDHRGDVRTIESEGIPAIFIHCMQRERYRMILCSHLRRIRQRSSLRAAQSWEKHLRTHEE